MAAEAVDTEKNGKSGPTASEGKSGPTVGKKSKANSRPGTDKKDWLRRRPQRSSFRKGRSQDEARVVRWIVYKTTDGESDTRATMCSRLRTRSSSSAEALRGVNSVIFDSSRLANVLGKRDYVTGTALTRLRFGQGSRCATTGAERSRTVLKGQSQQSHFIDENIDITVSAQRQNPSKSNDLRRP